MLSACGASLPLDERRDIPPVDAVDDRPVSPLRGCASDFECGGGLACNRSYPGGLCVQATCDSTHVCPRAAVCHMGACVPRCTLDGLECLPIHALCLGIDPTDVTQRGCFPSCDAMPAPGGLRCLAPLQCDSYRGSCASAPSTGPENGAACAVGMDCRSGRCLAEVVDRPTPGTVTGFVDGYCYSLARQVSAQEYNGRIGGQLPQSNCPAGSVVLPERDTLEGAPTPCWRACDDMTPCRTGYSCDHLQITDAMGRPMPAFANGACLPVDCTMAGMECPAGFSCQTRVLDGGRSVGTCARRAAADAGVPDGSSSDAATSDIVTVDAPAADARPADAPASDAGAFDGTSG